jgi:hypothetical protein
MVTDRNNYATSIAPVLGDLQSIVAVTTSTSVSQWLTTFGTDIGKEHVARDIFRSDLQLPLASGPMP